MAFQTVYDCLLQDVASIPTLCWLIPLRTASIFERFELKGPYARGNYVVLLLFDMFLLCYVSVCQHGGSQN